MKLMIACIALLAATLTGCVTTTQVADRDKGDDVRVGDVYEIEKGAAITPCKQFTAWELPGTGNTPCIVLRHVTEPAVGELPGPVRVQVVKIENRGAIGADYQYVFVKVLPGGKKLYEANSGVLANRVDRAGGAVD